VGEGTKTDTASLIAQTNTEEIDVRKDELAALLLLASDANNELRHTYKSLESNLGCEK